MRRIAIVLTLLLFGTAAASAHAASIVYIKGGNVWLAPADGSNQRQVTTGGGWDSPSEADDGTILAQRGTQLVRMNRQGQPLVPTFDTVFSNPPNSNLLSPITPVISPDGVHQAYAALIEVSQYYDPVCGCYRYHPQWFTLWGSATGFDEPGQILGQEDYVDPAWIDNSRLLLTRSGILIDQVATYTLGGSDNSEVQWFSDPDSSVAALSFPALTRAGDKIAFVADVGDGSLNEIRIYSPTGPIGDPAHPPVDTCNIGPNSFKTFHVSFSPNGQSLAYDAPDGIHLVSLTGWPACNAFTDRLIIPGGSLPYFGPADVGPTDGCGGCAAGGGGAGAGGGGGGALGGGGQSNGVTGPVTLSLVRRTVTRAGKLMLALRASTAGRVFARAVTMNTRRGRRHGAATLYGSGSASLSGAGSVVLTIKPTRAASAARRRRVTVSITVTFTAIDGSSRIVRLAVTVPPVYEGRR